MHIKFFKLTTILCTAFFVSACSVTGNQVYQCCFGQSVSGDENAVKIVNVFSAGDAMPLAVNHCQKYGKNASFDRMSIFTAHFKCIDPQT